MPELPVVGDGPAKAVEGAGEKAQTGLNGLKATLTKKIGPAPTWVWLAGGAAIVVFFFMRPKGSSNSAFNDAGTSASGAGPGGTGGPLPLPKLPDNLQPLVPPEVFEDPTAAIGGTALGTSDAFAPTGAPLAASPTTQQPTISDATVTPTAGTDQPSGGVVTTIQPAPVPDTTPIPQPVDTTTSGAPITGVASPSSGGVLDPGAVDTTGSSSIYTGTPSPDTAVLDPGMTQPAVQPVPFDPAVGAVLAPSEPSSTPMLQP